MYNDERIIAILERLETRLERIEEVVKNLSPASAEGFENRPISFETLLKRLESMEVVEPDTWDLALLSECKDDDDDESMTHEELKAHLEWYLLYRWHAVKS